MAKEIQTTNGTFAGAEGRLTAYDLTRRVGDLSRGLVVFAHGYKGFKDWGAWPLVAHRFAEAGFDFAKFNFSHNGGTADNPVDFPDLDAFGRNTYSKELRDLGLFLDHCTAQVQERGPIFVIGHSRGGGIAILRAAMDTRISKLATWAAVSDFGSRYRFDMEEWKRTGTTTVRNGRTGQDMPHDYTFYTDYIENRSRLDIPQAARKIEVPWLIVHGLADETVAPSEADKLRECAPAAAFYPLPDAGHTFGAAHPWRKDELPVPLREVVDKTIDFFRE